MAAHAEMWEPLYTEYVLGNIRNTLPQARTIHPIQSRILYREGHTEYSAIMIPCPMCIYCVFTSTHALSLQKSEYGGGGLIS